MKADMVLWLLAETEWAVPGKKKSKEVISNVKKQFLLPSVRGS